MEKIFSKSIGETFSKYRIVENTETNQQNSYNLKLETMNILLDCGAIKKKTQNTFIVSDDYELLLSEKVLSLIGNEQHYNNVVFAHTLAADGTEKFQIKRTNNLDGEYKWFSLLYDNNCKGATFEIYLDKDQKKILIDNIMPDEYYKVFNKMPITNCVTELDLDRTISEEDFKKWLSEKKKKNGEKLSKEMQDAYFYLLKSLPQIFGINDIFKASCLEDMNKNIYVIESNPIYGSINTSIGKGQFGSALSSLKEYINLKCNVTLTEEELIEELKRWCKQKPICGNITSSLIGFGMKYCESIEESGLSSSSLMNRAGIEKDNIGVYIDRGKDMYSSLKDGTSGYKLEKIKYSSGYKYSDAIGFGVNHVVYGTPGCGKSHYVDHNILGKNKQGEYKGDYKEENIIRTTFFQDYSNTDFVGQVMPVISVDNDSEEKQIVTYKFVPGPFTLALECAIANPKEKVALVIEELNRGNAPCIFGDLFQLLDRITENNDIYPIGTSEYGITNVNILNYLSDNKQYEKKYKYNFDLDEIRIPSNLFIYATMNTSDQNVFTLDTAFKRRWEFEKLINSFENHNYKDYYLPGKGNIKWEDFVNDINTYILKKPDSLKSEDKQLGVYFVTKDCLYNKEEKTSIDNQCTNNKIDKFAYKVFEYLWDDVAKFSRQDWFGDIKSLDELIDLYKKDGLKVFKDGIINDHSESNAS